MTTVTNLGVWCNVLIACTLLLFTPKNTVNEGVNEDLEIACIKAGGRGSLHNETFECMRMHKILKYKNGRFK